MLAFNTDGFLLRMTTSILFTIALYNQVAQLIFMVHVSLACSTRLVIINMVTLSHSMFFYATSLVALQDHILNRNMENHPGKPYNHKAHGSALAE
jgi:hypothetical protein